MVIDGVVVAGRAVGRELGFPTANIELEEGVEIARGVYRSCVVVGTKRYVAVSNVGVNPTVGEVRVRVESFLLDFEGDLYGERIRVELGEYLREERRFESVEELRAQITQDIERVKRGV